MSAYTDQRDAILAHAVAAAAAVSAEFTDVQVGAPIPKGSRCVRVFYAGESEPQRIGNRVLNGELIAETIGLIAFWAMPTMDETPTKALDTEMVAFKHELRTRILADSQLGGKSTDLEMGYAQPDFIQIGGTRWYVLEVEFTLDYIEYPLGA